MLAAICPLMYLNNAYLYPYVYVQTRIQGRGNKKYNSIIMGHKSPQIIENATSAIFSGANKFIVLLM